MKGKTAKVRTPRALWLSAATVIVLQLLLIALAVVVFDLFANDLLCRYGQSRWDLYERECYVPLPEP